MEWLGYDRCRDEVSFDVCRISTLSKVTKGHSLLTRGNDLCPHTYTLKESREIESTSTNVIVLEI